MSFLDRLRARLVDDWRQCWRWWSVQVNAFYAVLVALFVDQSAVAIGLAGIVSHPALRIALVLAVAAMWFLPTLVARIFKQKDEG